MQRCLLYQGGTCCADEKGHCPFSVREGEPKSAEIDQLR